MKCSIKQRAASSKRQAGFLLLTASRSLLACPLCKDSLPQGMARGFFWSILLMLTVPAVVVGVIARAVWRAERKKHLQSDFHHE